ncbi:hypothetical protein [Acinetobacter sp. YH16039]|uniref:hypothetical protein n=1 Tax=Acinetobacter sp. YH16039 TaxID=2601184 RepID=UPI0015D226CE|nr:hypothetical protein [Acinetobacter sp. YH16039]
MKMKKIALALAITATASFANADVEVDVGEVIKTAANASSSALNLSINNTDVIDASVYVRASTEGLGSIAGTLIDNDIKTTAIGAVQSGSIAIENAVTANSNAFTGELALNSIQAEGTDVSSLSHSINNNISDVTANTTNTSAGQSLDTTTLTDTALASSNVNLNTQSSTGSLNFAETLTSLNTDFSAVNTAYNNADINASVTVGADYDGFGALSGVNLGGLDGSIATTAIGAVQSGNITVTVK